jgi:hypothetical protein
MTEVEGKSQGGMPNGAELAAIPEASLKMSGTRRGKHRASEADVEVALKAERLKAFKNEAKPDSPLSVVSFDNVSFISNLGDVGISLGTDDISTSKVLIEISKSVHVKLGVVVAQIGGVRRWN